MAVGAYKTIGRPRRKKRTEPSSSLYVASRVLKTNETCIKINPKYYLLPTILLLKFQFSFTDGCSVIFGKNEKLRNLTQEVMPQNLYFGGI
jgi:hypothetical protein